jgi:hypothetical protein
MTTLREAPMSRITVKVNRRPWKQVKSFAHSGPTDKYYLVETNGDKATVIFGDGVRGAKPPAGSNVEATYRAGSGTAGEVRVSYRAATEPTPDQALWVAIRNRARAISFER